MNIAFGVTWGDSSDKRRRYLTAVALAISLLVPSFAGTAFPTSETVSVIVRAIPGFERTVEREVVDAGGALGHRLPIVNGFSAAVRSSALDEIRRMRGVGSVTLDARVLLTSESFDAEPKPAGYDPGEDPGSLFNVTRAIKARDLWRGGITGTGVDVALIDTGVVPVNGLRTANKVVHGPDLSFESQSEDAIHLDTNGHGTHMAGIVAGLDDGTAAGRPGSPAEFQGVAPGSRLVNVKVANAVGATDVSQVLAALNWVIEHRYDNGLNIRVINLSFGTDGVQPYELDPLTYAVETAWHKGIVVVVAAGNAGYGTSKLNNPAYDPYVIAVGANDTKGTAKTSDDEIPDWSSRGDGVRNPDVVAPGKSVVSLRDPGSHIDQVAPEGRVEARYFRGSGTSQSAAALTGAAALLLQARPNLAPDQVKYLLTSTATPLPGSDSTAQGAGMIDVAAAAEAPPPAQVQDWPRAEGTGSLDAARGTARLVSPDGVELRGEIDIFGTAWSGNTWSGNTWSGNTWSGGTWNGNTWSGNTWSGNTWSGNTWSGNTWSGNTWSGNTWSGNTWSGNTWSGNTWSGNTWSGASWSGNTWSGNTWSGNTWSGNTWS